MKKYPGLTPEALIELRAKTRDLRRSLMATVVLADSSVATCNEWISSAADYVGPHVNHISGKFLDHQLRMALITYGLSSTRPSPIICRRYFGKIETLKRDSLEVPELIGLGQTSNEESERDGMAMLDAFAAALEMFDLLDATPNSNSTHILRQIVHIAAYPPDNARNPAWNINSGLDHLSWSSLPQELQKRDIHYSTILIRPLPQLESFHAAVCQPYETSPPWFDVRPHHKCLLWVPPNPVENIVAILNSPTPPTYFSSQEYRHLAEKYLTLNQENDRLVKAIRAGIHVGTDYIIQALQTDFPLYARLEDYFSRLRARDVEHGSVVPKDPIFGSSGKPLHLGSVDMQGNSGLRLASESDLDTMSMFSGTAASVFTKQQPDVLNQDLGPFGIRPSDFPPRVISQMLSTHSGVTASSSSWRGVFKWAGFEGKSRTKKFMSVPMIGMSATSGKDLRAHTWPQDMILLPSGTKRVNNAALEEWIKRYDPMWCQFVPHHSGGGNEAVMNDLVHRQLVQRLIDQRLYAVASWDVQNSPGLWNTLLVLPYKTSGLIGAVFSSVGKPELPTPSGSNSLADPIRLFGDPVQLDVLRLQLQSFCPFAQPIQLFGRDERHVGPSYPATPEFRFGSVTNSGSGSSESGSNEGWSRAESPGVCEAPERLQERAYVQPSIPQSAEPVVHTGAGIGSPQQTFAFDFDFDSDVWGPIDPYPPLGEAFTKDPLDLFYMGD